MRLDEVGHGLEPLIERFGLARLHEPEMAFGQGEGVAARQGADDRDAERLDRLGREPAMALAADPVEDHAGDGEPIVVGRAALDDGRGRLRLAGDVERKQDRKPHEGGDVGRGAAPSGRRGDAVEEPHRGFAERDRAARASPSREAREQRRRHRPGIEIDPGRARGCGVEGGIDVVRPGLEPDDGCAPAPEGAQEPERQRRLAAARARRGDHQAVGHGKARPRSTMNSE